MKTDNNLKGDLRDIILQSVSHKTATAVISADNNGIISGVGPAVQEAEKIGLEVVNVLKEAERVEKGMPIMKLKGAPKQAAMAEDLLMGVMAKPSGIATEVKRFIEKTGNQPKIVCGAWKKMPYAMKDDIRQAVMSGGGFPRITPEPMIYLDKNYTRFFGGIKETLDAVSHLNGHVRVIQVKGMYSDIAVEAIEAAEKGASIVFIDTGEEEDIAKVSEALKASNLRNNVKIAYGGGIRYGDIDRLKKMDVDILDIGTAILNADLLDMKFDVIEVE
jgi:nicotinate-nucleotide pyrophosphorylase (carboxylating)